jgi:outer membrane protein assembly factor BamB
VKIGGAPAVIVSTGNAYAAVNADTGKELWRIRWVTQHGVNAADPIVEGDRMFISTGYGKGAALFDLGGGGPPKELWQSKVLRTQMNPAVLHNGFLYGTDGDTTEKGSFKCVEFATGTQKWAVPNFGSGAAILAGERLIAISGKGELMIAPASPDAFKPTARAQVLGGTCWTAPTLADGRVICRNSQGQVVCLDLRKQ